MTWQEAKGLHPLLSFAPEVDRSLALWQMSSVESRFLGTTKAHVWHVHFWSFCFCAICWLSIVVKWQRALEKCMNSCATLWWKLWLPAECLEIPRTGQEWLTLTSSTCSGSSCLHRSSGWETYSKESWQNLCFSYEKCMLFAPRICDTHIFVSVSLLPFFCPLSLSGTRSEFHFHSLSFQYQYSTKICRSPWRVHYRPPAQLYTQLCTLWLSFALQSVSKVQNISLK